MEGGDPFLYRAEEENEEEGTFDGVITEDEVDEVGKWCNQTCRIK